MPAEGWVAGDGQDGILSPVDGGPYVFLRQVGSDHSPLAFDVVLGAPDLDELAAKDGIVVERSRYFSGWGPNLLDIRDPDERVLVVREDGP